MSLLRQPPTDESPKLVELTVDNYALDMSIFDEEIVHLETSLLDINTPEKIPEDLNFSADS